MMEEDKRYVLVVVPLFQKKHLRIHQLLVLKKLTKD